MGKYVFGVDIGGTTVKIGFLSEAGELLEKWEIKTRTADNGANILPDVAKAIDDKIKEKGLTKDDIIGVGVGVPGPVDAEGIVHKAANLGWGEFDVDDTLSKLMGMKAKAGNDANVAALGEMWKGGGKGYDSIVMVTLGTGVGGGIIVDGKILAGAKGGGGEIGHIHINDNETKTCGCGNKGCLEQYASATGISNIAIKKYAAFTGETVLKKSDLSAKAVFDGVKEGDALCKEIAKEFGEYLGKGLAIIGSVIDPEAFVIGGGVSKAGEVIFDYICEPYKKYVFRGARECKLLLASLGNDAGMYGAAKLVMD